MDMAVQPDGSGGWLVRADGSVATFGTAANLGDAAGKIQHPAVAITSAPSGNGYWITSAGGELRRFGDAGFFGDTGNLKLNKPVVAVATLPSGLGYWFMASDGGIFSFGQAAFHGSAGIDETVACRPGPYQYGSPSPEVPACAISLAPAPTGRGYWIVGSNGHVFKYGEAGSFGSLVGGQALDVADVAPIPDGSGYFSLPGMTEASPPSALHPPSGVPSGRDGTRPPPTPSWRLP